MEDFYKLIRQITKDTPNDAALGEKIRHLIWNIDKANEQKLNAQKKASKQIDLEDMINEIQNGD